MGAPLALFVALVAAALVSAAAAAADGALPPPPVGCAYELVTMSDCLPFVSAPPKNPTASPTPACCKAFSAAVIGGDACLCYLVRNTSMLGFPLDAFRIVSLFPSCRSFATPAAAAAAAVSFVINCSGPEGLPELSLSPPEDVAKAPTPVITTTASNASGCGNGTNGTVPLYPSAASTSSGRGLAGMVVAGYLVRGLAGLWPQ